MKRNYKVDIDVIYDRIIDSAKTRFNYKSFAKDFDKYNKNIAENILNTIIFSLASKEPKKKIAYSIFNELLLIGFKWDVEEIIKFIDDKDKLFQLEIHLIQLSYTLVQDGSDTIVVLNMINRLLE